MVKRTVTNRTNNRVGGPSHVPDQRILKPHTRGLARQHRYVLKDKWEHYDMFVVMEDDMLLHGPHVEQHWQVTQDLYRLRQQAPPDPPHVPLRYQHAVALYGTNASVIASSTPPPQYKKEPPLVLSYHGTMTQGMLQRTVPGLFRVEAALPGWNRSTSLAHFQDNWFPHIPMNFTWPTSSSSSSSFSQPSSSLLDPSICCHVANETSNSHIPLAPNMTDLYYWETSLDALGIRFMPPLLQDDNATLSESLGWVLLLVGGSDETGVDHSIPDYWIGRGRNPTTGQPLFPKRPLTTKGRYANNQGGWMATKRQLVEWHTQNCYRGFLPPFPNDMVELDWWMMEANQTTNNNSSSSSSGMNTSQTKPTDVDPSSPPLSFSSLEEEQHRPDRLSRSGVSLDLQRHDGLGLHTVEYWSGGQQLFGPMACNLRRLIPLAPHQFSRHLIYHASNNKQRQDNVAHRFSSHNMAEFWAQLNAVRHQAQQEMRTEQAILQAIRDQGAT